MLESFKKILKVYPLPVFVLLLTFVVYYSAFELLKKKESTQNPISLEESMQNIANVENPQEAEAEREAQTQTPQITTEAPLTTPQQLPEAKPIVYLTSAVKSLNIRKDTSTQSPIVGKFTPTQMAIILEEKEDWILLADSNTREPIGWVLKHFVKEVENPENIESNANYNIAESKALETEIPLKVENSQQRALYTSRVSSLNIRETPSTEAKILNKLTPNDAVSIVEESGIWVRIQDFNASGKDGWVVRRSLILRN
ncbi:SH3 domain-containing protein [Helicobacter turcicus]|uniref:SH3 domain-containing protein n=1 Tax=Helicobacter turcicus TaxID=2867412 RepID=A0ABS7JNV1_9HELI|nr:SH3 domain-containing protein [Helicobacter turcicus]MBX7491040.1 SH3 domain-containing protein [Helicobacter turcicus]MBX7546301.1 SH3 domain-containing protein [Helicobacter turcicus]